MAEIGWDGIVSCHKCHAQVDILDAELVMADKYKEVLPVEKERLFRKRRMKPYLWVRLCRACAKQEGRL